MMKFLDTHSCVQNYFDRPETEFNVGQLGYHDFHYLKPVTMVKIQEYYTIHLIVSGKGKLVVNKTEYNLSAGDVFVLEPNDAKTYHTYYPDANEPWDYIFFTFTGTLVQSYLQNIGFSKENPVRTCNVSYTILPQFKELFEKRKNGIAITYFEAVSILFQLFQSTVDAHSPISHDVDLIRDTKKLIQLNFFNQDLLVTDISRMLYVSHSILSRLFKEKTGKTLIAYVNDCRLKHAEKLLLSTDLKASEICYMCGYKEYTYFLLQFKKRYGLTTAKYRSLHKPKTTE